MHREISGKMQQNFKKIKKVQQEAHKIHDVFFIRYIWF